jgi:hypothetical protein
VGGTLVPPVLVARELLSREHVGISKVKVYVSFMRVCAREREKMCVCSYIECMACLAIVSISGVYHRNIIRIIVQPAHTTPARVPYQARVFPLSAEFALCDHDRKHKTPQW